MPISYHLIQSIYKDINRLLHHRHQYTHIHTHIDIYPHIYPCNLQHLSGSKLNWRMSKRTAANLWWNAVLRSWWAKLKAATRQTCVMMLFPRFFHRILGISIFQIRQTCQINETKLCAQDQWFRSFPNVKSSRSRGKLPGVIDSIFRYLFFEPYPKESLWIWKRVMDIIWTCAFFGNPKLFHSVLGKVRR